MRITCKLIGNDYLAMRSIRPSSFCTIYPTQGHGVPGAYPGGLGAQGTAMIYKQINRLINNACFFLIV